MSDNIFLLPAGEKSPPHEIAGLDFLRDVSPDLSTPAQIKSKENDPALSLTKAQLLAQELNSYAGVKPSEMVTWKDGTKDVQTTVAERIARLPEQIKREFTEAARLADRADSLKAAQILNNVAQELLVRQQMGDLNTNRGLNLLDGRRGLDGRISFNNGRPGLDKLDGRLKFDGKLLLDDKLTPDGTLQLDKFSIDELLLLKYRLEQVITAPRVIREQHAAFLSEQGDLAGAQKLLTDSLMYGGGGPESQELRLDVAYRLKRQEIAGGVDPLEMARQGVRQQNFQNYGMAEDLFNRAFGAADRLDLPAMTERLKTVDKELAEGTADPAKLTDLKMEKLATEELLHASAVVRFARVRLAASQGHFAEATNLVEQAARIDPKLVADNHGMYLDMLVYTKTEGKEQSVFSFHNHLVEFQRNLSPRSFNADAAKRELTAAQEEVKKLPVEAIQQMKKGQTEKAATLEADLAKATTDADKQRLTHDLEEAKKGLQGLELLAHAPAYTRLMEGVFELCNKNQAKALEIFAEVEKLDPEYAKSAATQLEELRKFANMPQTVEKEESLLKSFLKELGYTAAAIAAGALVVVATGWSGPAALAAGFAAGSATRTGLKYMIEGEVKWYDPIIGGVDGLSGGAGVLVRRAALGGLNGGARALTAAERAMQAVSVDTAALQGLQGAERFERASTLAYQGLRNMGSTLPWYSKLPLIGNPAYREALSVVGQMGRVSGRNMLIANAAGGATTSLIFRGRQYAPKAFDGTYSSVLDFSKDYGNDVLGDTIFSAGSGIFVEAMPFKSMLPLRQMTPMLYGQRQMVLDLPGHQERLAKIDQLITELNAPSTPQQVRRWYLETPGPKVELYPTR